MKEKDSKQTGKRKEKKSDRKTNGMAMEMKGIRWKGRTRGSR